MAMILIMEKLYSTAPKALTLIMFTPISAPEKITTQAQRGTSGNQ